MSALHHSERAKVLGDQRPAVQRPHVASAFALGSPLINSHKALTTSARNIGNPTSFNSLMLKAGQLECSSHLGSHLDSSGLVSRRVLGAKRFSEERVL